MPETIREHLYYSLDGPDALENGFFKTDVFSVASAGLPWPPDHTIHRLMGSVIKPASAYLKLLQKSDEFHGAE